LISKLIQFLRIAYTNLEFQKLKLLFLETILSLQKLIMNMVEYSNVLYMEIKERPI
jgi:hypothetical protein